MKQDDSFFPQMTVKETLDFRVELKLGRKLNKADRDAKVDELLDLLSLSKVANTIVGDIKVRGISGGERKRLSIACELISSPAVIILDGEIIFKHNIMHNNVFLHNIILLSMIYRTNIRVRFISSLSGCLRSEKTCRRRKNSYISNSSTFATSVFNVRRFIINKRGSADVFWRYDN